MDFLLKWLLYKNSYQQTKSESDGPSVSKFEVDRVYGTMAFDQERKKKNIRPRQIDL
jgi:hypothetical protein